MCIRDSDQAYWKCYWENEGCLEVAGDACWHTLFWYDTCDGTEPNRDEFIALTENLISWEGYLECQAISPDYGSKEDERLECNELDTPDEAYWKCYWENEGCLEVAGDACWHTLFWYDTCDGTELSLDELIALS